MIIFEPMKNTPKIFCACLVGILIFQFSNSQDLKVLSQNFTLQDGLHYEKCYDLVQDDKGYVWIGTNSGLVRYDGNEFINFPVPENSNTEVYRIKILEEKLIFLAGNSKFYVFEHDSIYQPKSFFELDSFMIKNSLKVHSIAKTDTGNIVIEIEMNGKPSALATSKSKWWVIYDGENFNWLTITNIKRCIIENKLKYVEFVGKGDTKSKKAYLIKKQMLYKYKE